MRLAAAVLIYPGVLTLGGAAVLAEWTHRKLELAVARGVAVSGSDFGSTPSDAPQPHPAMLALLVTASAALPALAVALLPWPGNPLAGVAAANLWTVFALLQLPTLLLSGAAVSSSASFTQLAGVRQLQLTTLAAIPAVAALTAAAAVRHSPELALLVRPPTAGDRGVLLLAGLAYALSLPAALGLNPFAPGAAPDRLRNTVLEALPGGMRRLALVSTRALMLAQLLFLAVVFNPWRGGQLFLPSALVILAVAFAMLTQVELHTATLRLSHARDFLWTVPLTLALLALLMASF